jgi:hypothetical protein
MKVNLTAEDPLDTVGEIRDASKRYKRDLMPIWQTNMRRMVGDYAADLAQENKVYGRAGNIKVSSNRNRPLFAVLPTVNPKMHHSIASLVTTSRRFKTVPASLSRDDRLRAKGTSRMLVARQNSDGGQDYAEMYNVGIYTKVALPAFMLVEGDKSMPRPMNLKDKKEQKGDVIVRSLPAWRVHWESGLRYIKDSTWCMIDEYLSPYEVERRWPTSNIGEVLDDEDIYKTVPTDDPLYGYELGIEDALVFVSRLFIRPCADFPNGAQRVFLGDHWTIKTMSGGGVEDAAEKDGLIKKAANAVKSMTRGKKREVGDRGNESIDTPERKLPIIRFGGMPSAPASLDRGQMDLVGGMQRSINRSFTEIIETKLKTPAIYIQLPPGYGKSRFHNDTIFLEEVQRQGGKGIEIDTRPAMNETFQEIDWSDQKIDQLMNQPAPARGVVPGTRTSGKTMEASKQFSSTAQGPEAEAFNASAAEVQKRILICGREVWPESFVYKAIGESRGAEVREFHKADLASVTDIATAPEDPWPSDKYQRSIAISELQKTSFFFGPMEDPKTARKMAEAMKLPTDEDQSRDEQFQESIIDKHVKALNKGEHPPISFACDDAYHLEVEASILAEMEAKEDVEPDIQKAYFRHSIYHVMNQNRKEKALEIASQADEAADELNAIISQGTTSMGEDAAMVMLGEQEQQGM